MQAAFLRAKLPRLDAWNEPRRRLAARYDDKLAGIPGLGLPRVPQWAQPVWHLYVVRVLDGEGRRAELMAALDKAGIGSPIHLPGPPTLEQGPARLTAPNSAGSAPGSLAD